MDLRDWSVLPTDILLLILNRLPVLDYVRFGAVCTSWHRMVASNLASPAPQLPWLMLPPTSENKLTRVMFDPFTNKEQCRIQLPENYHCLGSTSNGYMFFHSYDKYPDSYDKYPDIVLLMLNPLTGSRIPLPPLVTLPDIEEGSTVTTSIATNQSPDPIVAISFLCSILSLGIGKGLAFCKPGDDSWTELALRSQSIDDIIFYKEQLYAVTSDTGDLCVFDFRAKLQRWITTINEDIIDSSQKYLVESSSGDLLKVKKNTMGNDYAVFKLDPIRNIWCSMISLEDDVILLSPTSAYPGVPSALCKSARDYSELRPNCIYSISYEPQRLSIFSLSDGRMEQQDLPPCSGDVKWFLTDCHWFTPCLL